MFYYNEKKYLLTDEVSFIARTSPKSHWSRKMANQNMK